VAALCAWAPLLLVALPATAQDAAQPVVYATYYQCDFTKIARMDSLTSALWGPLADEYVAQGRASAWGWLGHHTGGAWTRAIYVIAPDVAAAVRASDDMLTDALQRDRGAVLESAAACPVHEDYIWQRVEGSQPPEQLATDRPAAGLSIYYECSAAREERADELIATRLRSALDRAVESGGLQSWSWLAHVVGGKYRRALVTDGPDAVTVIEAVGSLSTSMRGNEANAFREFSEICPSHQDYVWSILTPTS
jgi:hypothetical protein